MISTGKVRRNYPWPMRYPIGPCDPPRPLPRLGCMRHYLHSLEYPDKDEELVGRPDPLIVRQARSIVNEADHILSSALHPKTRKG